MNNLSQSISDLYYNFVEASPVPIGAQISDGIIFINKAGLSLLNASEDSEVIGKSLLDFVHDDFRDNIRSKIDQVRDEKSHCGPFDIKLIRIDGTYIDVEIAINYFSFDEKEAIQFTCYEISVRKDMEEMISQSRADWEETFHAITDMVTIHDRDFNIIYANRVAKESLDLPDNGNSGNKCYMSYHGVPCPSENCPSCNCLKTGEPANFEIYEPGQEKYYEIRAMPRFDRYRQLMGVIHIARDITERKYVESEIQKAKDTLEMKVESRTSELKLINEKLKEEIAERRSAVEALIQSEHKYRNLSQQFNTLLDCIPDNITLLSPDLHIMWANKAVASKFDRDISKLEGQNCFDICCNISTPCDNCPSKRSFLSGNEETAEITTAEGKVWDIRSFPLKDSSGKVKSVIELSRDVTERVNLEASAARAKHLASLGELAAGVAHEINNPINNIINYAQILIDEFSSENRDDSISRRIIKDGDRVATIVRSLLSFARIRKEEKNVTGLDEIFSDTLSLASAQIRKDGIQLTVEIPDDLSPVYVHSQQIQQVFLNIISNARYALNKKYDIPDPNKEISIRCEDIILENKPFVQIKFKDTGNGIPENIIGSVMNPFFSTKSADIGTGLGLSISHGIVTEHGGRFTIESIEGEHTTVTVSLPASLSNEEK